MKFWEVPFGPEAAPTLKQMLTQDVDLCFLRFSLDGRRCFTSNFVYGGREKKENTRYRIWDIGLGTVLAEYDSSRIGENNFRGYNLLYAPDGESLVTCDDSIFGARIWNAFTGKERYAITGHVDSIHCIAWSPDGNHIATSSDTTTVKIWKLPSAP